MLRHFATRLYPAVSLVARRPATLAAAATTGCKLSTSATLSYDYILTEKRGVKQNVGLIQFNRPKALNALCDGLMSEVGEALEKFDSDPEIAAVVITGRLAGQSPSSVFHSCTSLIPRPSTLSSSTHHPHTHLTQPPHPQHTLTNPLTHTCTYPFTHPSIHCVCVCVCL